MIVLIDNYDSFTYNLYHLLRVMYPDVRVIRNDAMPPDEVLVQKPTALFISPGPGRPEEAGMCLELIRKSAGTIPILGVCLGHQALAAATGYSVVHAPTLVHGKTSAIYHTHSPLYGGIPSPFQATRYHSLMVQIPDNSPWNITAKTTDNVVMSIEHRDYPWVGVQFHPESILTRWGPRLVFNFLRKYAGLDVIEPEPFTVDEGFTPARSTLQRDSVNLPPRL